MQSVINTSSAGSYNWFDDAEAYAPAPASQHQRRRLRAGNGGVSSDRSLFAYFEAHSEGASKIGFVACVIFYGLTAAYGMSAGGQWDVARRAVADAANDAALKAGLEVKAVQVEGQQHLKDSDIDAALGPREGVSIFAFDTDAARERLKRFGFVGEARVMRLLPSTLVVEIEERKPFALWRDGDKTAAIDESGKALALVSAAEFPDLPVVSGAGAAAPAKAVIDALALLPDLRGRVREIERIAGRRWDLLLDTGLRVKLPATDFAPALADLSAIAVENPGAFYEIAEMDFRVPSQFTLRLKDATDAGRHKFLSWLSGHQDGRKAL